MTDQWVAWSFRINLSLFLFSERGTELKPSEEAVQCGLLIDTEQVVRAHETMSLEEVAAMSWESFRIWKIFSYLNKAMTKTIHESKERYIPVTSVLMSVTQTSFGHYNNSTSLALTAVVRRLKIPYPLTERMSKTALHTSLYFCN